MSKWAETAIARRLTVALWAGQAAPLVRYHKSNGFFAPCWPIETDTILHQSSARRSSRCADKVSVLPATSLSKLATLSSPATHLSTDNRNLCTYTCTILREREHNKSGI